MPTVRTQKLRERIASLLDTDATVRKIAGVTGTVISLALALGPVARLWTKSLYHQVKLWQSWDRKIEITPESMYELHFWKSCFEEFNGRPICPISPKCTVTSYSDTSSWGWEGCVVQVGGSMSKGNFSEREAGKSSVWRELQGTFNVLSSSTELIRSQILKHHTNNKNVKGVLSFGSMTSELQELVTNTF